MKTICESDSSPLDDLMNENVIVRTVTHYYTGKLVGYDDKWMVLDDAAWIADTGRWSVALKDGKLDMVEPYPGQAVVGLGAVVDICKWDHALPRTAK